MSLQYIIDGYNIINHKQFSHFRKKSQDVRKTFLDFIKTERLTGSPRNKATVVFDGYPNTQEGIENYNNICIVFSKNQTADESIRRILEKSQGECKNIVVVSDDKEIIFFVKSIGAQSLGVEEFIAASHSKKLARMQKDIPKPELSYSQVQKINQEFKKIWLK